MSERSKETVLKTVVGKPTASSNLASSANGVSSQSLGTLFSCRKPLIYQRFCIVFVCLRDDLPERLDRANDDLPFHLDRANDTARRKSGTIALQLDRTIVALLRLDGVKYESRATSILLAAYKILRRIRRRAVEHFLVLRNA